MNWKYYMMHVWPKGERWTWAEVFILPDDPAYEGEALWLTIDCVGASPPGSDHAHDIDWHIRALAKLGESSHAIVSKADDLGDSDMIVAANDFSVDEFLGWVKVWIKEQAIEISKLIPAPLEDFIGRHRHADLLHSLTKSKKRPEDEG